MTNKLICLFVLFTISSFVVSQQLSTGYHSELKPDSKSENRLQSTPMSVKILVIIPPKHGANTNFYLDDMVGFGWEITLAGLTNTVVPCPWSAQLGNLPIVVDTLISDIQDVTFWDVLAIMPATTIGGNAYGDLLASGETLDLIVSAVENNLVVWATCAGVRVLAAADVINGINVTGNASYQAEYIAAGANFLGANIPPVIDGNIVTSTRGMYFHYQNTEAIATVLESQNSKNSQWVFEMETKTNFQKTTENKTLSWSNIYGDTLSDGATTIIPLEENGYFIAGYTYCQSAAMSNIRALWLNADGDPIKNIVIGGDGNDFVFDACEGLNNNIYLTGYTTTEGNGMRDFLLVNIEHTGEVNWQKFFGGTQNEVARSIYLTSDASLLICGYTQSLGAGEDDIYLVKTDLNGNLIWQKTFGGLSSETGHKVIEMSDGNYLVLGTTGSFGAGNRDMYIIKTDTGGNLIWEHTYGTSGYQCAEDVIETSANELLIVGSSDIHGVDFLEIYVVKTDFDGNEIFSKYFSCPTDYYDYGKSVCETNDGNLMICSMVKYPETRQNDAYLFLINPEGEMLWDESYGGERYESASKIIKANDGGFVFAGQSNSWGNGSIETWVVKIDNPLTNLKEFSNDGSLVNFSCSPNPFTNEIKIGFKLLKIATFSIVNMQGETVLSHPYLNTGTHEIIWTGESNNGQKLPAGNYLVIVTMDGQNLIQHRVTLLK